MSQVPYVEKLNYIYQESGFPPYKWSVFDSSPWTPLEKPLEESCIALLSSAGISLDNQEPFDPWAVNDLSFRKIPKQTPPERLRLHHNYFDHRDALRDINCVFPIERLFELEQEGTIGKLAPLAITLGMGRLYKRTALQQETVPQIMNVLKEQETDAVILIAA